MDVNETKEFLDAMKEVLGEEIKEIEKLLTIRTMKYIALDKKKKKEKKMKQRCYNCRKKGHYAKECSKDDKRRISLR